MRRVPAAILACLLLPALSGCLDEDPARPEPEPPGLPGSPERILLTNQEASDSPLTRATNDCPLDDYRFSIMRRPGALVDGHAAIEVEVLMPDTTTGLQFGHQFEDEPMEWYEPVYEGTHRWTIPVEPDQGEAQDLRWSFWWRFAPQGVEDCNMGAMDEAFVYTAHAVPPGA